MAEAAARAGARVVSQGAVLRAASGAAGEAEAKGHGDWVSAVDLESEAAIRDCLRATTPHIGVLAEEGGGDRGEAFWAVDPLDGTTNFLIGFPVVAVSVGLVRRGRCVAGAVRAPLLGLSFRAALGHGAWSGLRRLRVSDRPAERAIVATAFPFRRPSLAPRYMPALRAVLSEGEDIRRAGAAALDLAWVAAGVFDGYFELNLSVWDLAAGSLLVQEAGGVVTDWSGGQGFLRGEILAGSPAAHGLLVRAVSRREARTAGVPRSAGSP